MADSEPTNPERMWNAGGVGGNSLLHPSLAAYGDFECMIRCYAGCLWATTPAKPFSWDVSL